MEAGGSGKGFVDVEGRTTAVHNSGLTPFKNRNPHMQGVTLALQLAFGIPVGGEEYLNFITGRASHVFDSFAMANLLLCSSVLRQGSQSSLATATMRQSCAKHLAETANILKPTLVISQGWGLVDNLSATLKVTRDVRLGIEKCHLAYCDLNGHRFVWVALYHPTRFWSSPNQAYFKNTVSPAIKEARRRALRLARTG